MSKPIFSFAISLGVILLLTGSYLKPGELKDDERFTVSIFQNGKLVELDKDVVRLKKAPFDIVFEFSEPMAVLVNASFDNNTLKQASAQKPLDQLPGFEETGMAEGRFNDDREVLIKDSAPSYWHYESDTENRFNEVQKTDSSIICKRTIENVYDVNTNATVKIEDVRKDLHMVFISYKTGEDVTGRVEVQRAFLTIKWKK